MNQTNQPKAHSTDNDIQKGIPCEWYGKQLGPHDWIETSDGWKRCTKCKFEYKPEALNKPLYLNQSEAPSGEQTHNVFEVYGSSADAQGWDCTVCSSLKGAMHVVESDLDALNEGGEVRIVFKRYTQAQMDEVVYE